MKEEKNGSIPFSFFLLASVGVAAQAARAPVWLEKSFNHLAYTHPAHFTSFLFCVCLFRMT